MAEQPRRWFYVISIVAGLAFIPLCCVSIELAYRLVKRHSLSMPTPTWVGDPELIYKLNPLDPKFPQSFRGKAPSPEKTSKFRIVCLGGSTTFGPGLNSDEVWPAVMERVLRTKGIDAEVINAGVQGYGSRQLLVRYRRDIAAVQPDYVVIYEGWNGTGALVDPGGWVPLSYGVARPGQERIWWAEIHIINHSLILQRIVTWVARRHARKAGLVMNAHRSDYHMDSYHDLWVEDFMELVREIKAHQQQPVLVLYPALYFPSMTPQERSIFEPMLWVHRTFQQNMLGELERKHEALRAIAQSTDIPLVDVQGEFSSIRGQQRAALFVDEMHLTTAGNQKVGEVIGDFLASLIFHGTALPIGSSVRRESRADNLTMPVSIDSTGHGQPRK